MGVLEFLQSHLVCMQFKDEYVTPILCQHGLEKQTKSKFPRFEQHHLKMQEK